MGHSKRRGREAVRPPGDSPVSSAPSPAPRRANLPAILVLLGMVSVLLAGAYLIFSPFAAPLVLALVFAISTYPLFEWILARVGTRRRALASGLTCGVLIGVVFVPLVWLGWSLVEEIPTKDEILAHSNQFRQSFEASALYKKSPWVSERWDLLLAPREPTIADGSIGGVSDILSDRFADILVLLEAYLVPFLKGTLDVSLKFCLMVFALFFFLKDAPPLLRSVERQVPLLQSHQQRVATTFVLVSRSIIRGTLGTALAQGLCATVVYLVIGVPAVLWGFLTTVAALVPPLGIWLVTGPMVAVVWLKGQHWQALVLLVASGVISVLDNVIKPLLMREGVRVHSLWLLLSILGGLNAFGAMGLLYGPMVLVLLGTFVALFVLQDGNDPNSKEPDGSGVVGGGST